VNATPRLLSLATAVPPCVYDQQFLAEGACETLLGPGWRQDDALSAQAGQLLHLFAATRVRQRYTAVDLAAFYAAERSTAERMAVYERAAYELAQAAATRCLECAGPRSSAGRITDLILVSCTGYAAPGLDVRLARDLDLPAEVRRTCVGHMGCYGALVGLRQALTAVRADPDACALVVTVELSSLHFTQSADPEVLTAFALFGDAAAAALVTAAPAGPGPELAGAYCAADFRAMEQMSWRITDHGFMMGLSPRIPVTLRRAVQGVVQRLLVPHGLDTRDITHWIIHPGGPSILEAIQERLALTDGQLAPSWQVLRDFGNCSSSTVLLILDELLRSGRPQPGEWGVMMAFGPGLTLETCLLRF
jgi:predicted naringenin-chalcone synthase